MSFSAVILAAGKGKRMRSLTPKCLHAVLGKPIILHALDTVKSLKPEKVVVVVGNRAAEVKSRIRDRSVRFVFQRELLGTGNAVLQAQAALRGTSSSTVVVLNGDSPLLTVSTLRSLLKKHARRKNDLTFLAFRDDSQSGYGRIIRDSGGNITGVVEDRHTTAREKEEFRDLNAGVYAIEKPLFKYLKQLRKHRAAGEYYLTDIVALSSRRGNRIGIVECPPEEGRGINTRKELHEVTAILNRRNISRLLKQGVTFINPSATLVHSSVTVGRDSVVYPNTCLEGDSVIGRGSVIYPGVRVLDSSLGAMVIVKDNTLIEDCRVRDRSVIGPGAHLSSGSTIGSEATIGSFAHISSSTVGSRANVSHHSFIRNARIGKGATVDPGAAVTDNSSAGTKAAPGSATTSGKRKRTHRSGKVNS